MQKSFRLCSLHSFIANQQPLTAQLFVLDVLYNSGTKPFICVLTNAICRLWIVAAASDLPLSLKTNEKKREAIIGTVQRAFPVLLSGRQPLYKASGVVPIHSRAEFGLKCCPSKQHRHPPMNQERWWYGQSLHMRQVKLAVPIPHLSFLIQPLF